MKNFVITIARGYGSGGKTIGKMLSERMGIHYYDQELLRLASDESGINEKLFGQADECLNKPVFFKKSARSAHTGKLLPPNSQDFTSMENLFNYQAKVIEDLAKRDESCVIVGRCADYILRDYDNVLSIYVHAPKDYCIRTTREIRNLNEEEAWKFIQKTDKRRSDYYRYFTGNDWKDADNYDLCLNSAKLGWDKCMDLIEAYLKIKLS